MDLKPAQKHAHPQWLFKTLRKAYPDDWQTVMQANNEIAPLTLRVNTLEQSRDALLNNLAEHDIQAEAHAFCPQGIQLLQSVDISQLPSYDEGGFSVQEMKIVFAKTEKILQPKKKRNSSASENQC